MCASRCDVDIEVISGSNFKLKIESGKFYKTGTDKVLWKLSECSSFTDPKPVLLCSFQILVSILFFPAIKKQVIPFHHSQCHPSVIYQK